MKKLLVLILCLSFLLIGCGKLEDKKADNRVFMMTVTQSFLEKEFNVVDVNVRAKDFATIDGEELKGKDGTVYKNTLLASGIVDIDKNSYKYSIIAKVDDKENPTKYKVLFFETIEESEYNFDILED